jgi:phosphatidylserine/phosphatidylglycerophosphate/cardiolipin synthase-like enzyme
LLRRFAPVVFLVILAGLFLFFQSTQSSPPPEPQTASEVSSTPIEVFFTEPENGAEQGLRGGPDAKLVDAINNAQFTIDAALYDLNLWSIRDALIDAHSRGVRVRVVAEANNADSEEFQALVSVGLPLVTDFETGLMHHKFIVIDGFEVWTGSMNLTLNGAYRNDNNLLRLESFDLAENYSHEFEEMYIESRFGPISRPDTPHTEVMLQDTRIESYFSPDDRFADRLLELIEGAENQIEFLAFAFTSDPIGDMLLERHRAGVEIRGVMDSSGVEATGSEYERLTQGGIDLRIDGNEKKMHHKIFIIDRSILILGSYNFTRSAEEKNDENILILHDSPIISEFLIEFERIYRIAAP